MLTHAWNQDPLVAGLTPREYQTRLAFFILGSGAPLVAALFALFTTKRWWTHKNLWTFPRLVALWFITISVVAIVVYVIPERTTRSTLVTVRYWPAYDISISVDMVFL